MELFEQKWWGKAACLGMGPELFLPESGGISPENDARVLVCKNCPVRQECLEYAVSVPWVVGIWGGTSAEDRERMRRHNGTIRTPTRGGGQSQ